MDFELPYRKAYEKGGTPDKEYFTFPDPGLLPEELTYVPGFINELTDWTMEMSQSPHRVIAFVGALMMLAHLTGRSYTDTHGTHTNLYMILLGESGIGKEAPRKTNMRIADKVGFSESVASSFPSGPAMEDALAECPSILLQTDEVEVFFGRLRNAKGGLGASISERLRTLFTSSGSKYIVRGKAGEGLGAQILCPHLSLFGTGTTKAFLDAMTPEEVHDGLFGRCLVIPVEDLYVSQDVSAYEALPDNVVATAQMLAEREKAAIECGCFGITDVGETEDATQAFAEVREKTMELRRAFSEMDMPIARATVVRMNEKIAKLALLYAISEDPRSPKISRAAVEWATKFVVHVTRWMLFEGQFHASEGRFGHLKDRALASIARAGGSIDRRSWIRSLGCDATTFARLVKTLLLTEDIDSPEYVDGRLVYRLRSGRGER